MPEEVVVLVDMFDNELGTAPKLQVHRDGVLHRAVSVFIFNPAGEMLLQRRAEDKYHSPGLWSNAACSHPRPGEEPVMAAERRLREELGVVLPLRPTFSFLYRAEVTGELTEHELDHVFVGLTSDDPSPDPAEVSAWRWISRDALDEELAAAPERFTAWFPLAYRMLMDRERSWRSP
jgi:isopentenyl-diphosphate Delta-isomerase